MIYRLKYGTSGFRKPELPGFTLPIGQDLILENLSEINVSSNFLDIHKNFGTNISMEISQNFGGEYFYPLNPELPGYKHRTSGFTAVLGKLQRIREKCQSIRVTPENPGWNPENLDYSQNWAKYLKSVDRV